MQDDMPADEPNLIAPTDTEVKEFFNQAPRRRGKIKNRKIKFVDHKGEQREMVVQYGNDLAAVLRMRFYQGLGYSEISKLTGLNVNKVKSMIMPFKVMMDDPDRIKAFRANEPEMLDGVRALAIQAMYEQLSDPVRRKKVDLSRLTYLYGVLFDKTRLSRGESTSNVKSLSDLVRAAQDLEMEKAKEAEKAAEEPAQIVGPAGNGGNGGNGNEPD